MGERNYYIPDRIFPPSTQRYSTVDSQVQSGHLQKLRSHIRKEYQALVCDVKRSGTYIVVIITGYTCIDINQFIEHIRSGIDYEGIFKVTVHNDVRIHDHSIKIYIQPTEMERLISDRKSVYCQKYFIVTLLVLVCAAGIMATIWKFCESLTTLIA